MPTHRLAVGLQICLVITSLIGIIKMGMKTFVMADCFETTYFSTENLKLLNSVHLFVLNTSRIIHRCDKRFLSFSIDSKAIRKDDHTDFIRNLKMKRMVSYLSPGYLRIGGIEADRLIFKPENSGVFRKRPLNPNSTFYMTEKMWMEISRFAKRTGLKILFNLNVLLRKDFQWDSSNAKELLEFSAAKDLDVDWQLGNEPNSFRSKFNMTVTPAQLATDFMSLRRLLDCYPAYRTSRLVGPDVTSPKHLPSGLQVPPQQYLHKFTVAGGSRAVIAVAWHHYYLHRDGKTSDFLSPSVFDSLKTAIDMMRQAVAPVDKPLWITESGSASGGGIASVTDRFISSFLFLDCLGLAAREGLGVVVRQSLYTGNYALIDKVALTPNPDYWVAFVYKRLVSPKVLSIQPEDSLETPSTLRLYAHCGSNGTVVVFGSNIGNTTEQLIIKSDVEWSQPKARFYQLSAPSLLSRKVFLNSRRLMFPVEGGRPHLHPYIIDTTSPIHIKPLSMFFIHLNNLSAHLC